MKPRILIAALLAVPSLALAQAASKAPAKDGVVAKVNGVSVPSSRMDFMLQQQTQRGAPDNEQTRAAIRDELINREVVAQEAAKTPLAKTAEVQQQLEFARQGVLIGAFINDYLKKHPVSDADVQKEYDRVKALNGDKEYKARHILVDTEDQAKGLIADLKKGAKFDELASKNSKDQGSKTRGGDLDWAVPTTYDKAFSDAMVKLEKGKFTDVPVRTRFGFHVIQLDDVRPIKFPALAEVKPRIQQELQQNKIADVVKELRSKAKVE